ncbi:MAG: hypothetical protein OHK93_006581 [Ramalina farinacea]|uniref:SPX domain-containing protein n=1 Tax=Ramalina farinacea TaxID=258253 RepID=A0AA43QKC0_9LECA|nr:hypothetical protein [Ramalina farinacea]
MYNVDYDDLKYLIKLHTTGNPTEAQPIPNGKPETLRAHQLEDQLFEELERQHARVNDFVQVKSGEVSRRLTALDQQISRLELDSARFPAGAFSSKRATRYAKLDNAVHRAGQEIDFLSRFAAANTLAFSKLLKKYRKWTGSHHLDDRFRSQVLNRESSLFNHNFQILLSHYTEILTALRSTHDVTSQATASHSSRRKPSTSPTQQQPGKQTCKPSSAAILYAASHGGNPTDFDAALAIVPLGDNAVRASYWIHVDNLMNIEILVLQHTSHLTAAANSSLNKKSQRHDSDASTRDYTSNEAKNHGLIVCDDLQAFSERQGGEIISDMENRPGASNEKAVATIRFCNSDNAIVTVDSLNGPRIGDPDLQTNARYIQSRLKRKAIRRLFLPGHDTDCECTDHDLANLNKWFADHPRVKPLVKITSTRSRFQGLGDSLDEKGAWATLDRNIAMERCTQADLATRKSMFSVQSVRDDGAQRFPHAVLEVHCENGGGSSLLKALDGSHLAERVRGFSLEEHAVAELSQSQGKPRPYWISALEQDIRKLPALSVGSHARVEQAIESPEQANTRHTSTSAPSTRYDLSGSGIDGNRAESLMTSAPETLEALGISSKPRSQKKSRPLKRKASAAKKLPNQKRSSQTRYWNEFDDGSEGEQHDGYAIYVNPDPPPLLPGTAFFSACSNHIAAGYRRSAEKIHGWFGPRTIKDPERQPLVPEASVEETDPEDSDLSDDEMSHANGAIQQYYTFPNRAEDRRKTSRVRMLFWSSVSAYCTSLLSLLIAIVLLSTGRKRTTFEVDIGVTICVVAAMILAVAGAGSAVARRKGPVSIALLVSLSIFLLGLVLLVAMVRPFD